MIIRAFFIELSGMPVSLCTNDLGTNFCLRKKFQASRLNAGLLTIFSRIDRSQSTLVKRPELMPCTPEILSQTLFRYYQNSILCQVLNSFVLRSCRLTAEGMVLP